MCPPHARAKCAALSALVPLVRTSGGRSDSPLNTCPHTWMCASLLGASASASAHTRSAQCRLHSVRNIRKLFHPTIAHISFSSYSCRKHVRAQCTRPHARATVAASTRHVQTKQYLSSHCATCKCRPRKFSNCNAPAAAVASRELHPCVSQLPSFGVHSFAAAATAAAASGRARASVFCWRCRWVINVFAKG